jgi:type VI secretion system FHA domain protein
MALTIKITSDHRELVRDGGIYAFHEQGGTIGRSLQNDWILPDPDRFISGRHATIDFRGGMYYLADVSTNGVFMNDEEEPIGKGNPRRLFDGDRMRMGDFEFVVRIEQGESISVPLDADTPLVDAADVQQFVEEDVLVSGVDLLDAQEITGDDEFQRLMFGSGPKKAEAKPEPKPEPKAAPNPESELARKLRSKPKSKFKRKSQPTPNPRRTASPLHDERGADPQAAGQIRYPAHEITAEDLFDSFLDGLGVSRVDLHPSLDKAEAMLTAGMVLREFVDGMVKMLASRANLKGTFALEQTMLLPRHNNPMKFSDNPNELVKQLLIGGGGEYLGARDAVREVNQDLLNHQDAFLDAMTSAFGAFADRFDPDELQNRFDGSLEGAKVLGFLKKSKYWELYREFYAVMSVKGDNNLPQMFRDEFVKAYEEQVAEYERQSHVGAAGGGQGRGQAIDDFIEEELLATRKLQPRARVADAVGDDSGIA